MKRIAAVVSAMALIALAAGCETGSGVMTSPDLDSPSPIGEWHLTTFELDDGTTVPAEPGSYTLTLKLDGSAHVEADCNVCNGDYELQGSSLLFGPMGCTLAACQEGSLEFDYLQALGAVSSFERTENELALRYGAGVLRFVVP